MKYCSTHKSGCIFFPVPRFSAGVISQQPTGVLIHGLTAKLFNWNFHALEVVSRSRDPQLQVSENYSDLTKLRSIILKSC